MRLKAAGYIMIEVMLAMTLLLLVGAQVIRQRQAQATLQAAVSETETLGLVLTASKYYIDANRTAILTAAADGTGAEAVCRVNADPAMGTGGATAQDSTDHTCMWDVTWLQYQGHLQISLKPTNAAGSRYLAIARRVYYAGSATNDLELLVVPASKVYATSVTPADAITMEAYQGAAGAYGTEYGVVPDQSTHPCGWGADDAAKYLCGTMGAWKARLSDFLN